MEIEYNKDFYYKFLKFVKLYMNFLYRIEANGLDNIPKDGNYLLAGNHLNILDSWLLMSILNTELRFMVDKKLYRYKLWEKFFKSLGTFGIDPEQTDIKAVKTSIDLIKEGNKVVIFPEGKTHKITESVPFKPGVASIAKLAKTSLIPFGIRGSYRPGAKLNINFGEPIDLSLYKKDEYDFILENNVRKLEMK